MAELRNGIKTFHARSGPAWRKWLEKNHESELSVWLIMYNKGSKIKSVTHDEAVNEALCFGWIDSKANKRDDESHFQFFSRRNPKSNWSGINKKKVEKLLEQKLMKPAGLAMVELAKRTGTWDALNDVESLVIPPDLQLLLNKKKKAMLNWNGFSPSSKRAILQWIKAAKREETRKKRIEETVRLAALNIKANQP